METVEEPHRLIQSLNILTCICVPLIKDEKRSSEMETLPLKFFESNSSNIKGFRSQALFILNNILPGIDLNDIGKSALTFQVIFIILKELGELLKYFI